MARQYQGRVPVVGMAGRDDVGPMRDFVEKYDFGFAPHAVDDDGALWARFGVRAQPAWVFVDKQGGSRIAFGPLSNDDLREELDRIASS